MSASGLFPSPYNMPYINSVPATGGQVTTPQVPVASFPKMSSFPAFPTVSNSGFPQWSMVTTSSFPQMQPLLSTNNTSSSVPRPAPVSTGAFPTLPTQRASTAVAEAPTAPKPEFPSLNASFIPVLPPVQSPSSFPVLPSTQSPSSFPVAQSFPSQTFTQQPLFNMTTTVSAPAPPAFTSSYVPPLQPATFSTVPVSQLSTVSTCGSNGLSFPQLQMTPISSPVQFAAPSSSSSLSQGCASPNSALIPVELRDNQVEWAQRILTIYKRRNVYADTSITGCGKTCVCIWVAQQFPQCRILNDPTPPLPYLLMVVICPATVKPHWMDETRKRGMQCFTITYESLRGTKTYPPSHGLLDRFDIVSEGDRKFTRFVATEHWYKMVNKGVMVVVDENQKAKNASAQSRAVQALLEPVHRSSVSKAALLSFTPFEKPENAVVALRLLGILKEEKLYNIDPHTKEFTALGIQEIIDVAAEANATLTQTIVLDTGMSKSKMNQLCYNLLSGPIKATIAGAMPPPINITGKLYAKSGFYKISGDNAQKLEDAVNQLSNAVGYKNGEIDHQQFSSNMGAVNQSLMAMEDAKLPDMVRVAWGILSSNPNAKMIICLNYIDHIKAVAATLSSFQAQTLMGSTPAKKRQAIIEAFNTPSAAFRLIVMNPEVGGVGINLHDKSVGGFYPRYMLISPGYKMGIIAQAAGRIYRDGTTSDATVSVFYGRNDKAVAAAVRNSNASSSSNSAGTPSLSSVENIAYEMRLLLAMRTKSETNYGMLDEKTQSSVKLPGDWEHYYEQ